MQTWLVQTKSTKDSSETKSLSNKKLDNLVYAGSPHALQPVRQSHAPRNFVDPSYDADAEDCASGRALYNVKVADINMNQILTRLNKFTGDKHESDTAYVDEEHGGQVKISRLKSDGKAVGSKISKNGYQQKATAANHVLAVQGKSSSSGRSYQIKSASLSGSSWRVLSASSKVKGGSLRRQSYPLDGSRSVSHINPAGLNVPDNVHATSRATRLPSISEDKEDSNRGETVSNGDSGIEETSNNEESDGHRRDSRSSPEDDDFWNAAEDGLVARFVHTLSDTELESAVLQKPMPRSQSNFSSGSEFQRTPEATVVNLNCDGSSCPSPCKLCEQKSYVDQEICVSEPRQSGIASEENGLAQRASNVPLPSPVRETIPIVQENNGDEFDVRHCVRRVRAALAPVKMAPNPSNLQGRKNSYPRLPCPEEILSTLPPVHYPGLPKDNMPRPPDLVKGRSAFVQGQGEFCIKLDVRHYGPEEVLVVLESGSLVVSGERFSFSEYGCESCHFYRQYILPEGFTKFDIASKITESGILVITGRKTEGPGSPERQACIRSPGSELPAVVLSGSQSRRRASVDGVDFQELDDRYVLLVDCYGCAVSDLSVRLEGRDLLIQTKATLMQWEDRNGRHKSTTRTYALPENAALESVSAGMIEGDVLKVEVLKLPRNDNQ